MGKRKWPEIPLLIFLLVINKVVVAKSVVGVGSATVYVAEHMCNVCTGVLYYCTGYPGRNTC